MSKQVDQEIMLLESILERRRADQKESAAAAAAAAAKKDVWVLISASSDVHLFPL